MKGMKKLIITLAIIDVVMWTFVIAMHIQARGEYVTATSGVRLRASPEGEVLTVIPFREEIGIIDDPVPGWLLTEYEGREGVVSAEWISDTDPAEGWAYQGEWLTTAYTWSGYQCFDGSWPQEGYTCACNSLDIGTEIYVEGIGQLTVVDRGPTCMPWEWLDIYLDSYSACVSWGARSRGVWIIEKP